MSRLQLAQGRPCTNLQLRGVEEIWLIALIPPDINHRFGRYKSGLLLCLQLEPFRPKPLQLNEAT